MPSVFQFFSLLFCVCRVALFTNLVFLFFFLIYFFIFCILCVHLYLFVILVDFLLSLDYSLGCAWMLQWWPTNLMPKSTNQQKEHGIYMRHHLVFKKKIVFIYFGPRCYFVFFVWFLLHFDIHPIKWMAFLYLFIYRAWVRCV